MAGRVEGKVTIVTRTTHGMGRSICSRSLLPSLFSPVVTSTSTMACQYSGKKWILHENTLIFWALMRCVVLNLPKIIEIAMQLCYYRASIVHTVSEKK